MKLTESGSRRWKPWRILSVLVVGSALGIMSYGVPGDVGGCGGGDLYVEPGSAATLTGALRDWNEDAVSDAEVLLSVGGMPITESVRTDAQGYYELAVPAQTVRDSLQMGEEVTLLFYCPYEDLPPLGTAEGDRIHLLPVTLREFIDVETFDVGRTSELRTAYVPLQARGYKITEELLANGGELTWSFASSPVGGQLDITLILEPGSIRLTGDEPQREITLTPLDATRAPMQIPVDGYGVLWTIQPRDVVFEPAARIRVTGDRMSVLGLSDVEVGTRFDIYGASLEQGWQLYGQVELMSLENNRVTIESPAGIISRGAWGHVFSGTGTDSGCLVTCRDAATAAPVPCAVLDDNADGGDLRQTGNVNLYQYDYRDTHREFYYTDIEPVCSGCTNNGHPESQLALALFLCKDHDAPAGTACDPIKQLKKVKIRVVRLCGDVLATTDANARDAILRTAGVDGIGGLDAFTAVSPEFGVNYRSFSYNAVIDLRACP